MPHLARSVPVGDTFAGPRDRSDPASPGEGAVRLSADALAGRAEGLPR